MNHLLSLLTWATSILAQSQLLEYCRQPITAHNCSYPVAAFEEDKSVIQTTRHLLAGVFSIMFDLSVLYLQF